MRPQPLALLLATALGSHQIAIAGAQGKHLEPVEGTLSGHGFQVAYDQALRTTFLREASESPYLRMIVEPSFQSEWMVEVLEPVGGQAVVRIVTADEPVWAEGSPVARPTTTQEGVIPEELATVVKQAWVQALRTTRYTEPALAFTMGVDGTTFQFISFVEGEGILAGQTSSPSEGTLGGRLVEEGAMLRDLARTTAPTGSDGGLKLTQHARQLLKTLSKGK